MLASRGELNRLRKNDHSRMALIITTWFFKEENETIETFYTDSCREHIRIHRGQSSWISCIQGS